jgi:hypothetical protein
MSFAGAPRPRFHQSGLPLKLPSVAYGLSCQFAHMQPGNCQTLVWLQVVAELRFDSRQTRVWQLPNSGLADAKLWSDSCQTLIWQLPKHTHKTNRQDPYRRSCLGKFQKSGFRKIDTRCYELILWGSNSIIDTYSHGQYRPKTLAKGLGMTTDSEQALANT